MLPRPSKGLKDNADFLEEISKSTMDAGLVHHRFVSGDGELVVIDQWETADQFQSFLDGNAKVAHVMSSIGMTEAPEISVFDSIDAAGTVWMDSFSLKSARRWRTTNVAAAAIAGRLSDETSGVPRHRQHDLQRRVHRYW
ncbi:MAG TPA: hypothetical protein VGG17_04750 [Acidimicrobiales bacterium]|jgi:hypothetical protein